MTITSGDQTLLSFNNNGTLTILGALMSSQNFSMFSNLPGKIVFDTSENIISSKVCLYFNGLFILDDNKWINRI